MDKKQYLWEGLDPKRYEIKTSFLRKNNLP